MLLGGGADELFGGYSRYRRKVDDINQLIDELQLDVDRLWLRNLGE